MNSNNASDINPIFPNWMAISPIIEKERNGMAFRGTQYHYTNIAGFISILENRDFWLSNIRYMNDSQEFENGVQICKKILESRICEGNEEIFPYLKGLLDACASSSSKGFFRISKQDIFAISFCPNGDLLTQWNFYGNGGISIGFDVAPDNMFDSITFMDEAQYEKEIQTTDPDQMRPHDEIRFHLLKVIYDDTEKIDIINKIINIGADYYRRFGHYALDMCIDGISDVLFYYFALMKDEHFSHEGEYRFFVQAHDEKYHISFRQRGHTILPYLKLKILDVNCRPHNQLPISDIIISPCSEQQLFADSVKYFLEKGGYNYLVDKVRLSTIPYRDTTIV